MNLLNDDMADLIELVNLKQYHPYLYRFDDVNWSIFGSLTWEFLSRRKDNDLARWQRKKDFNGLMNSMCARYKLRRNKLAYYEATEYGKAGEMHCHFLIASEGLERIPAEHCAKTLENLWVNELKPFDSDKFGIGTAVVKPYDRAKENPGVQYCLKVEKDEFGTERERHDFPSPALMKLIKKTQLPIANDFAVKPLIQMPDQSPKELFI